ncbi:MAG: AI-2E family transporter [Anaeromyxobacter sp.]
MPNTHAPRLIVGLLLAAIALALVVVWPFWQALFMAAVLAAALRPAFEWLARRLGGRRGLAAGIATTALLLVVVLPLATFGTVLVQNALEGLQWLREAIDSEGIWGLLSRLPDPVEAFARRVVDAIPDPAAEVQKLAAQGGQAAAAVGGVLAATGGLLLRSVLALVAFYFLLVDGPALVDWADRHVPLGEGQLRQLLVEFRQTSVSVLTATLVTAALQTLAAFVGYLLFGAPRLGFLTAATFAIALVPAAGATIMVVLAGILQLAAGHTLSGALLVGWGFAVVSMVDNIVRPMLLRGGTALHGGVVFFALLGGVAVFGPMGLLLGPLAVTFLLSVVRMYERQFSGAADLLVPPLREEGDVRAPPR